MERKDINRIKDFVISSFEGWIEIFHTPTPIFVYNWHKSPGYTFSTIEPGDEAEISMQITIWDETAVDYLEQIIKDNFEINGGIVVVYRCPDNEMISFEEAHIKDIGDWGGAYEPDYGGNLGQAVPEEKSEIFYIGWD